MSEVEALSAHPVRQSSYIEAIAQLLGGSAILGTEITTREALLSSVHAGLPRESATALLSTLEDACKGNNCEVADWLRESLIPDERNQLVLSPKASDRTLRIASLLVALLGIFGSIEFAVHFLLAPHPRLGDKAPAQAVFSNSGVKEVEALILRGLHGLPA